MKLEDPEKYEQMREAGRQRDNARNAEKRRKLEEGQLTEQELAAMEQKRTEKMKNAGQRQLYLVRKVLQQADINGQRLTRTSLQTATPQLTKECCCACKAGKRPRNMNEEEQRLHSNALRQASRDRRSSQKRTADRLKVNAKNAARRVKKRSGLGIVFGQGSYTKAQNDTRRWQNPGD